MRQFQKILIMDTVNLFLNPIWIFYSIGFPVIAALILGFLTSGSYGNTVSSYDYYGVAILFFAISNTAMLSANSFMEERIKSPNLRILYSLVRPFCIHFSKVAATFIFSSVSCTIAAAILRITSRLMALAGRFSQSAGSRRSNGCSLPAWRLFMTGILPCFCRPWAC